MTDSLPGRFSLIPTAVFVGLGIGNLWGATSAVYRAGSLGLSAVFPAFSLLLLVLLCFGFAHVWRPRAYWPLAVVLGAAWLFSAPWAALHGKFALTLWLGWLPVLIGAATLGVFAVWLRERRNRG